MSANTEQKLFAIRSVSRLLVYRLYIAHINGDVERAFTLDEISALFGGQISKNTLRSAIELVRRNDSQKRYARFIQRGGTREAGYRYTVTEEGIEFIESQLRMRDGDIFYFHQNGNEALYDVAGINGIFYTAKELADINRLEPIEFASEEEVEELVSEIGQAITVIEQSNEIAAAEPTKRDTVIRQLRTGVRLLADRIISSKEVVDLILSPLKWVASNFSAAVAGEMAKRLAQKIVDHLFT